MALLVAGFSLNLNTLNPVKRAFNEFHTTDVFYSILNDISTKEISKDIIMIDIHDITQRRDIARVIDEVNGYKPKVIMIDVLFVQRRDIQEDEELMEAISALPSKVSANRLDKYDVEHEFFSELQHSFYGNDSLILEGYCNTANPELGITRSFSLTQKYRDSTVYSLPYLTACIYLDKRPKTENILNERTIEFDPLNFLTIKPNEIANYKQLIKDRIVIIGAKEELLDEHYTPIGRLSGMEILSYSVHTILKKQNIKEMSNYGVVILTLLVIWLCIFLSNYINNRWPEDGQYLQPTIFFFIALVIITISFFIFAYMNYYIPLLYPLMALALTDNAIGLYQWGKTKAKKILNISQKASVIVILLCCYSTMQAQEYVTYSVAGSVYNEKKARIRPGDILSSKTKIDIRKESAIIILDKINKKMYSLKNEGIHPIGKLLEDSNTTIKNLTKFFCRHLLSQIVNHNNSTKDSNYMSGATAVYRADSDDNKIYNRIMTFKKSIDTTSLNDYQILMLDSCILTSDYDVSLSLSDGENGKNHIVISNSTNSLLFVNVLRIKENGERELLFPVDKELTGINSIIPAMTTIRFLEYPFDNDKTQGNLFLLVASEEMIDFTVLLRPFKTDCEGNLKLGLQKIVIK